MKILKTGKLNKTDKRAQTNIKKRFLDGVETE